MRGITRDTFIEMIDRKLVWIFLVVTLITLLIVVLTRSASMQIEFGGNISQSSPFTNLADKMAVSGLSSFLSFLVFLSVLATAGLIPSMLVRGRAEYFLSKPISRTALYLYKLFGIWFVYGGMMVCAGMVIAASFYLIHGIFNWNYAYLFILNLASFFVWLSITTFAGVMAGSAMLSVVTAFVVLVVQLALRFHEQLGAIIRSPIITKTVDILYYIFPKTGQMADITEKLASGQPVTDWLPVWSTLLFAIVLIVITSEIFKRKDY